MPWPHFLPPWDPPFFVVVGDSLSVSDLPPVVSIPFFFFIASWPLQQLPSLPQVSYVPILQRNITFTILVVIVVPQTSLLRKMSLTIRNDPSPVVLPSLPVQERGFPGGRGIPSHMNKILRIISPRIFPRILSQYLDYPTSSIPVSRHHPTISTNGSRARGGMESGG